MEQYKGIKFKFKALSDHFQYNEKLITLNKIAYELASLGLTPIHDSGAYGNFSIKLNEESFVISKSAFTPELTFREKNYSQVYLKKEGDIFTTNGIPKPSSETPLHHAIYCNNPDVNVVIHGHYDKFENENLMKLTDSFYDYGTQELVDSAIRVINKTDQIIYLREHGFVAFGSTLELTLESIYKILKAIQL